MRRPPARPMLEERLFAAEMSHLVHAAWNSLIEYETPRLVKIHNRKVGIVREDGQHRVAHSNDRRSERR